MNNIKEGEQFEGQIEFSNSGNANITIDGKKFYIYKKNTSTSFNLDIVRVELFKTEKGKLEAKVIEIISRNKTEFVGTVHINGKNTFVVPDNNKISTDFYIKGGLASENNDKVLVELVKWDSKSPQAKITKILGKIGENETEMNSIMYEYGLPVDFPQGVISESELISEVITEKEISKRRDMRKTTTLTIDPDSAKDFDDAISVEILNDNLVEVGVHIADVSHYVNIGSEVDEEAYNRATSVYLVDRCVPMLPERLSNNICSLKPNVDRLAFSAVFKIDRDGNVKDEWFGKTIINSDKRFSYEDAQSIIEGGSDDYESEIVTLNDIAQKMRKKRIKEGSIEMGGVEVRFKLAEDNKKPIGVYYSEQKEANKLIEEFMLLANKSVAKLLSSAGWHNVYRVHDTPNEEKLVELSNICRTFGHDINLNDEGNRLKSSLNKLLRDVTETPEENMIKTLVTRCMSKAKYTIENIGHYGLGFNHYSHFTSPIRRYPDLMTHRILFDYLNKKSQGNPVNIEESAKWCSSREIIASRAQRDSIKYKQAEYLMDRIGQTYIGVVSGVTEWGLYIEIIENKCEGMVRYKSLDGKWSIDLDNYQIKSGLKTIRLGDEVSVIVSNVDLEQKKIDFLISNGI